jgi:hypothetical protein
VAKPECDAAISGVSSSAPGMNRALRARAVNLARRPRLLVAGKVQA